MANQAQADRLKAALLVSTEPSAEKPVFQPPVYPPEVMLPAKPKDDTERESWSLKVKIGTREKFMHIQARLQRGKRGKVKLTRLYDEAFADYFAKHADLLEDYRASIQVGEQLD
jgi:hypothetical protein